MIQHKDETSRTMREFREEIDPKLRAVLLELDHFTVQQFGINLTIVSLIRTLEEQMKLNPDRPNSSHVIDVELRFYGRAGDIRSHIFTVWQSEAVARHIKDTWGDIVHFKHHDSGSGDHFHININRAFATRKEV